MKEDARFDRELANWPEDVRVAEWQRRIEAVLFASATPVARDALLRVIGQGASLEVLMEGLRRELASRPYEIAETPEGWLLRTKSDYAEAIKAAANLPERTLPFSEMEMAVLAAVACNQPIDRAGLKEIFGREVSRDLLNRLRFRDLITNGPRAPRPGAPHTFITTQGFLTEFGLSSLRDVQDMAG